MSLLALVCWVAAAGCCKAACAFGAAGCLCKQSVVDMTNSVMKVDSGMAKQFINAFASKCGFQEVSLAAGE
ncbi:hypothetical protein HaLaN_00240 [Haematococcus lacustris]|uniref:Uncharacterized protein n=2 Tax=Haematococcus lacustris TaxID=44745 RepID=A0A699YRK8_HAELA|nr:hypothetical protein HaLaN_00240 [Haematococcus lacustris]